MFSSFLKRIPKKEASFWNTIFWWCLEWKRQDLQSIWLSPEMAVPIALTWPQLHVQTITDPNSSCTMQWYVHCTDWDSNFTSLHPPEWPKLKTLTAQWEKTHIFSHFSLIFQARKVKMKRFKSIKLMKWKIFVAINKPVKLKRELKREPRKKRA